MNKPTYVYIDESNNVGVADTPPTDSDLASIENGLLYVLELTGTAQGVKAQEIDGDNTRHDPCAAVIAQFEDIHFHEIQGPVDHDI